MNLAKVGEEIVTLFKNVHGNVNVALAGMETIAFIEGKFFTASKKIQAALQAAADAGEHGIYVDPNESEIDTQAATPMAQLEKQIRAKVLAEMASTGIVNAGVSAGRGDATFAQSIATTEALPGASVPLMTEEQWRAKFEAEMAAKSSAAPASAESNVSNETPAPAPTPEAPQVQDPTPATPAEDSALSKLEALKKGSK